MTATTQTQTLATLALLLTSAAWAEPYDFYDLTRYPEGGKLKPGVDLYKPVQAGSGAATAYERRTVDWWPRKGVDIIEIKDGMSEREWTWREKQPGLPASFKAHLIAFRGMGNTMSSKFHGDGGPIEPAVVLRLADGRKRCFPQGSFAAADKQFIMDLYVKAMDRIKAGMDKTPRVTSLGYAQEFPDNAKPGEPGTMQVKSEHFIWFSGSQAGSDGDPWVSEKEPDKAEWFRKGSIECAEFWWALNEYAGHLMPFWDQEEQVKFVITVPGTKRDGYQVIPGFAGGGYGGCAIKGAGGGPWAPGLFHEWGHGARGPGHIGGGEAFADTHQCLAEPGMLKANSHLKAPWRNIFNGGCGYGFTEFYSIMADDPNWGYGWYVSLPSGADEHSIMQLVARVGQQRGLFKNGIRGFGDMMGEYGARLATFDCELEDLYRKAYFAPARSWLEPVDPAKGVYRIPIEEAPEPYGVNIVRLVADGNAAEIVVDFTGLHDPDFYSDWRACIAAVGADGKTRYSPLWSKGGMTVKRSTGDISYWLTVAATPTAICSDAKIVEAVYSGRYAFRYPWSVRLTGAKPGTPRECRADFSDVGLRYAAKDSVPAPIDTPEGKAYRAAIAAFIGRLDDSEDAAKLKPKLQAEIARMEEGRRHPNGGGWVAKTATVADTAYVGPDAMVLGNAKVLDQAIVEDDAVLDEDAMVSGHARISGQAIVKKNARAGGYARTWDVLTEEATEVPKRVGADKLNENSLWANYAMDREEKTVLADWYRYTHEADKRYGMRLGVNLDGYLIGRPQFVVDGERQGFSFDGKTQYAELCPRVADLGQMTVDLALKVAGQGAQTILDLGSAAANCLVLRTDAAGKPELVAMVGGKIVARAAAGTAMATGAWTRLRIEIDGKALALWVDGVKAASQVTSFRPCDAFPAGAAKRNFLAASRDGSNCFKGVIDYVVFYHSVSDDFSKLPPPIRDAPARPSGEFIAAVEKSYGNVAELNKKIGAEVARLLAPYNQLNTQIDAQECELLDRSPAYLKAEADLKTAKKAIDERKVQLQTDFANTPDAAKIKADIDTMKKELSAMSDAARKNGNADTKAGEQKELTEKVQGLERSLGKQRDQFLANAMTDITKKTGQAEAALANAYEEAMEPYWPEKNWIRSFRYAAFRGYYNTAYNHYLNDHVKAILGGGEMRENLGVLTELQKSFADGTGWHTTVDWEWRTQEEVDGKIKKLPLMQKWLVRVRGKLEQ